MRHPFGRCVFLRDYHSSMPSFVCLSMGPLLTHSRLLFGLATLAKASIVGTHKRGWVHNPYNMLLLSRRTILLLLHLHCCWRFYCDDACSVSYMSTLLLLSRCRYYCWSLLIVKTVVYNTVSNMKSGMMALTHSNGPFQPATGR